MKRKRIGNDINIAWAIMTEDGKPFDLSRGKVSLYLKNYVRKEEVKGFSIEGNVILWTFLGKNQKNLGNHSLELVINEDADGMITTDACDFVCLVPCSCKEGGEDDAGVKTETLNLTSVITLGGGGPVDDELNPDSKNAISNRAVTKALESLDEEKQDSIKDLDAIREGAKKGDTAIQKVKTINNQSIEGEGNIEIDVEVDTELSEESSNAIANKTVTAALKNKVEKVDGKQLSTEDFTSALKAKLEGLSNYDDTTLANAISGLETRLNTLVSGDASTAIESFNEIMAFLDGIKDSQNLSSVIAAIEQQIAGKQNTIDDLADIRAGAAKGATALQEHQDISHLATKEELTNLTNEMVANEEVHAAAYNDLDSRLKDIGSLISGVAVTKEEFQEGLQAITDEMVANEEVHAAAYSDLNSRLAALEAALSSINQ